MSLASLTAPDSKAPRRRVAKSPKGEAPKPQKVSLYLSPKVAKALGVHAVMTGESQSAVADSILADALRRFVVSDRAKPSGEANPDGQAMLSGSASDPQ